MKGVEYTGKVTKLYNESFKPANRENRSFESIRNRVKLILKNCTSFPACFVRICSQKPSGASQEDLLNLTTGFFNDVKMSKATEDCGKAFKFKEAWEVLRHHEKFRAVVITPPQPSEDSSLRNSKDNGDSEDTQSSKTLKVVVAEEEKRPIGRRRAKEEQLKVKVAQEKLLLADQSVATEVERNNVLKRHLEIMLFTSAPEECDKSESVEYFKLMRARALEEARDSFRKHRTDEVAIEEVVHSTEEK